jgi:nitrogen fixation protein FixH
MAKTPGGFIFTGRHMLIIMIAFFGVVIGVNMVLVYVSQSSWSGLVVDDTYRASQRFNTIASQARALAATGIRGDLSLSGRDIRYQLSHPQTGAVDADAVTVVFKRPVGEYQDFTLVLNAQGNGEFTGEHNLAKGQWIVDITSQYQGRIVYHEAVRRIISGD